MARKSKTLRNLLSTISSLVVISSGIAQVEAGPGNNVRTDNGGDVTLADNSNDAGNIRDFAALAPGAPINFVNNNNFAFRTAVNITTGSAVTVKSIDLNGHAARPFIIAHNTRVGSVVDLTGGGIVLNAVVNDGIQLTLTGEARPIAAVSVIAADTYTGLGNITLGNAGVGHATLNIICTTNTNC
jgi:hypothetical protein